MVPSSIDANDAASGAARSDAVALSTHSVRTAVPDMAAKARSGPERGACVLKNS